MAFNRLVLKWEQRIYNLALRMLNDREEAADAAQEIFLLAYRGLRHFKGESNFSTWLHRIAINYCITRLRRRPPLMISIEEEGDPGTAQLRSHGVGPEEYVLKRESTRRVLDALALISPQQRAVIELKVYQDETFNSIAAVLETSESTIKSRFYAALEALRSVLGNEEDFHV